MRRALVLTHEGAGHWMRRLLPPASLAPMSQDDLLGVANDNQPLVVPKGGTAKPSLREGEVRLFLTSYAAFFVAASVFIW